MDTTKSDAAACGPCPAPGCSKSESDTPRTNAASVDGWQTDDDSRYVPWFVAESLERELAIAVAALKTIAEPNYSILAIEPTAFADAMGAKMALHRIHALNPSFQGTPHETTKGN